MPVDPHLQRFLDLLERRDRPPIPGGTADEAREAFRRLTLGARRDRRS